MTQSRLSDMSIIDDILRVTLYKSVLSYVENTDNINDLIVYEIKEDESDRPDLLSMRVYGTPELRWLVMLLTGNEDEFAPIESGNDVYLPPLSIVRTMIREVRDSAS
jgi:hypothetical protein